MDDKIYRGPGHPVGAHFHSGPKGERGLPGVSPKVDMTYNEEDGTVVFTVSDGYGQREQTVPMAELMDDWMEHDSYEVLKQWMDTHSDAEWWVDENHGLHLSNVPPDADDRIVDAVEDWLDDHPEATTTVQDGSITWAKIASSSKGIAYQSPYINASGSNLSWHTPFVTPEMFGAKGDGVTDDTNAFAQMFASGIKRVLMKNGANYVIGNSSTRTMVLPDGLDWDFNGATLTHNPTYNLQFRNFDSSVDVNVLNYNGRGNMYIHGGTIVHPRFAFLHSHDVVVRDMNFDQTIYGHVFQVGGCRDFLFDNCVFNGQAYNDSWTMEIINIECADYTGQPYLNSGSPTYDYTTSKFIKVYRCSFLIGEGDYAYMGDGVGVHYCPYEENNGTITNLSEPFEHIEVVDNYFECTDVAAIKCNYWKNSKISGNTFLGYDNVKVTAQSYCIELAKNSYKSCDNVEISNNKLLSDFYTFILLGQGKVTNLAYYGNNKNLRTDQTSHSLASAFAFFSAVDKTDMETITFTKTDGIALGDTQSANQTFTPFDCFQISKFTKIEIFIGAVASNNFQCLTVHRYHNQLLLPTTAKVLPFLDQVSGEPFTITLNTDNTVVSSGLGIRYIIGYCY